jgi:hypothetical protein
VQLAESTAPPQTPIAAAWSFFRPSRHDNSNNNNSGGTGLEFIDAALRKRPISPSSSSSMIVMDVRGSVGKTWTIISLAARFVVATRPSRFLSPNSNNLPQVLLFNARYDVAIPKLVYAIRANLLLRSSASKITTTHDRMQQHPVREDEPCFADRETLDYNGNHNDDWLRQLETEIQECLSRIHIVQTTTPSEWVPILECIRHQIADNQNHSRNYDNNDDGNHHPTNNSNHTHTNNHSSDAFTLILWDGFLHGIPVTDTTRMEIVRQMERFFGGANASSAVSSPVVWVTTTTDPVIQQLPRQYEQLITHRIRLEKQPPQPPQSELQYSNPNGSTILGTGDTIARTTAAASSPYVAHVHGSSYPFHITTAGILS